MANNRRAFTLIELLVVIAIIAILAAILFPVFAQAKVAAKKTAALSDVKQLSLAYIMYGNDSDDVAPTQNPDVNGFPTPWYAGSDCNATATPGCALGFLDPGAAAGTGQTWGHGLFPYVKSLGLFYDSAPKDGNAHYGWNNNAGAGNTSFVYNGIVMGKPLTSASDPSALITFQNGDTIKMESDVQPTQFCASCTGFQIYNGTGTASGPMANGMDINWVGFKYNNGDVYGFSDGHARYIIRSGVQFRNYGISVYGVMKADFPKAASGPFPNTTTVHDGLPADDDGGWWASWGIDDISNMG